MPPHEVPPTFTTPARWRWGLRLFVPLWLLWLALNGANHLWPGLGAAALSALAGSLLAPGQPYAWRPARLIGFGGYFVRESLRGGIDVAGRALRPTLPVDPCWVVHTLHLPAGQPRALMLSVVTLLPGSLSVDLEADTGRLHVHLLSRERGATQLQALEDRIALLFGLGPGERP